MVASVKVEVGSVNLLPTMPPVRGCTEFVGGRGGAIGGGRGGAVGGGRGGAIRGGGGGAGGVKKASPGRSFVLCCLSSSLAAEMMEGLSQHSLNKSRCD